MSDREIGVNDACKTMNKFPLRVNTPLGEWTVHK